MPRPTKALNRTKLTAAEEYKKGNRKEAYAMWAKAAQGMKEHREKKKNKNKNLAEAAAAAAAAATAASA